MDGLSSAKRKPLKLVSNIFESMMYDTIGERRELLICLTNAHKISLFIYTFVYVSVLCIMINEECEHELQRRGGCVSFHV